MALNAARHQDASRYSNGMPDSALKLLTFWGVWAMIFVLPMCVVGTIASLTMKGDYKTITMRCANAYFWMSALNTLIVLSVGLAVKGSERYHIQEERVKNDEDNGGMNAPNKRMFVFEQVLWILLYINAAVYFLHIAWSYMYKLGQESKGNFTGYPSTHAEAERRGIRRYNDSGPPPAGPGAMGHVQHQSGVQMVGTPQHDAQRFTGYQMNNNPMYHKSTGSSDRERSEDGERRLPVPALGQRAPGFTDVSLGAPPPYPGRQQQFNDNPLYDRH